MLVDFSIHGFWGKEKPKRNTIGLVFILKV